VNKNKVRMARWVFLVLAVGFCIYLSVVIENISLAIFAVVFIAGNLFVARMEKKDDNSESPDLPEQASDTRPTSD
jgi:hypothetical protein